MHAEGAKGAYHDNFVGLLEGHFRGMHLLKKATWSCRGQIGYLLGQLARNCCMLRGHLARVGNIPVHLVLFQRTQAFPAQSLQRDKTLACRGGNVGAGGECTLTRHDHTPIQVWRGGFAGSILPQW